MRTLLLHLRPGCRPSAAEMQDHVNWNDAPLGGHVGVN